MRELAGLKLTEALNTGQRAQVSGPPPFDCSAQ
jgi:hypothetical protein